MKTINFGIIGCGLMGREFASAIGRWAHLSNPAAKPRLTAVCDTAETARAWFRERLDTVGLSTASAAELLASKEVDAVYIAVPHDLHAGLYVQALKAGKHVLGEKPFGIDLPACRAILEASAAKPDLLLRCSSEFPFFPGAQRIIRWAEEGRFGRILACESGFLHSSDLDPDKPINWKRRSATCGAYGVMADLGMHALHVPLRLGFSPKSVQAILSKVVLQRPDGKGGLAACETWDNALLTCRAGFGPHPEPATRNSKPEYEFPLTIRTERIAPGETDTWYLEIRGTSLSARFSTKEPRTLRYLEYEKGKEQAWKVVDLGYQTAYPTITGGIFEFGFTDAILQMWAAFVEELSDGKVPFGCATPQEALATHQLFTAALESQEKKAEVRL
jgi:predicted dehydrogenase